MTRAVTLLFSCSLLAAQSPPHVIAIRCGRLIDGKSMTVATIDAPQALVLRREPRADVGRYDALRGKAVRHAS